MKIIGYEFCDPGTNVTFSKDAQSAIRIILTNFIWIRMASAVQITLTIAWHLRESRA